MSARYPLSVTHLVWLGIIFFKQTPQVLHVRSEDPENDLDPKPRFCKPIKPQLFVLDETPYIR